MQVGPSKIVRYTCSGCTHLELRDWTDLLENDEKDSGTYAECHALGSPRYMTAYYTSSHSPPSWCPFMESKVHNQSLEADKNYAELR